MGVGSEIGHGAVRAMSGGNRSDAVHEESKGIPQAMDQTQQSQHMNHPCATTTLSFLNVRFI